jgi:hypothetical protein
MIDMLQFYQIEFPIALITNYKLRFITHKVHGLDLPCDNLINAPKPFLM